MGLSPHPPPVDSAETQNLCRCSACPNSPLSTWRPGMVFHLRLRLPCKKLSPCFIGPFKIMRQINEVTYQLQLPPPRYCIHPTFHLSLRKPCSSPPPDQHEPDEPPPPEILDEPSVYQVRNILDSVATGKPAVVFQWSGRAMGPRNYSWMSRDDILDPMLLQDFHRTHPDCLTARGRGRPPSPLEGVRSHPWGRG